MRLSVSKTRILLCELVGSKQKTHKHPTLFPEEIIL